LPIRGKKISTTSTKYIKERSYQARTTGVLVNGEKRDRQTQRGKSIFCLTEKKKNVARNKKEGEILPPHIISLNLDVHQRINRVLKVASKCKKKKERGIGREAKEREVRKPQFKRKGGGALRSGGREGSVQKRR